MMFAGAIWIPLAPAVLIAFACWLRRRLAQGDQREAQPPSDKPRRLQPDCEHIRKSRPVPRCRGRRGLQKRRKPRCATYLFSIGAFDVASQGCWRDWPTFRQRTAASAPAEV
jgi:hypothetical protein